MKSSKIFKAAVIGICAVVFLFSAANLQAASGSSSDQYTNLERIPGQTEATNSFVKYIENLYSVGIGIAAILAVFMIAVGAFQYIVFSAGNAGKASNGKDMIYSAIYGLILTFLVWLIFFVINPDLLHGVLTGSSYQTGYGSQATSGGAGGGGGGTTNGYKAACPDSSSKTPIDYTKASSDSSVSFNSNCSKYDSYFQKYASGEVDACMLKTVAMLESTCGNNKGSSGAHACGLMQMQEGTATSMNNGQSVTCNDLINNDDLAVQLSARYLAQNISKVKSAGSQSTLAGILAGYNSGYECVQSGKAKSLCKSKDCDSGLAYECCVNPGGLDESINYAWNGSALYSQCKNGK